MFTGQNVAVSDPSPLLGQDVPLSDIIDVNDADSGGIECRLPAAHHVSNDLADRRHKDFAGSDDPGWVDHDNRRARLHETVRNVFRKGLAAHVIVDRQPDIKRHAIVLV
jgi:hypothetical protein